MARLRASARAEQYLASIEIEDIQVNGSSAKGLTISLNYENTRREAEGESESSYKQRCNTLQDILRTSKTGAGISRSTGLPISSHHMFVLGALNFRLRFDRNDNGPDDSVDCVDKSNVEHALKLVIDKSWESLYSKDELTPSASFGRFLIGFGLETTFIASLLQSAIVELSQERWVSCLV